MNSNGIMNEKEAIIWFHSQVEDVLGNDQELVRGYSQRAMTHYAHKVLSPRKQVSVSYGLNSGLFILTFNGNLNVIARRDNAEELLKMRQALNAVKNGDFVTLQKHTQFPQWGR
jgi:hypothetical protein